MLRSVSLGPAVTVANMVLRVLHDIGSCLMDLQGAARNATEEEVRVGETRPGVECTVLVQYEQPMNP